MVDHFDTSLLAEVFTDKPSSEESRRKCRAYLYNVFTKNNDARLTMLNLAELKRIILFKIKEDHNKLKALDEIKRWLDSGIEFCSPQWKAFEIALELKKINYLLEPLDGLHIATAIEHKANRFVTIEKSILGDNIFIREVKSQHGLKIVEP